MHQAGTGARRIAEYALFEIRLPDAEQVRRWRVDDQTDYCRRLVLQPPLDPTRLRNPTPMGDHAFYRWVSARLGRELSRCAALLSRRER